MIKVKSGGGVRGALWSAALLGTTMLAGVPAAVAQDADRTTTIDDVIVTAQKRDENLQDVPISIQALGGERLDQMGVSDFNDYVKLLPSVSYQTIAPGFSGVYMRGIASGGDGNHSGSLPSVGVYLDEQPVTTIQGPLDVNVYDMNRVEALAGPQGTLYGASSQAGTIRLITNKPDFSRRYGQVDVEANSVAHGGVGGSVEGFVNLPISDRIAARVVGWYRQDAGYIDNVPGTLTFPTSGATINNASRVEDDYNDSTVIGGRAALRIDLDDTWTATASLMGQSADSDGNWSYDPAKGDLKASHFYPETLEDRWYQAALTVTGRVGNWDLVYAGAYMNRDDEIQQDYSDYSFFYDTLAGYGAYWTDDAGTPLDNPSQYIQATDQYRRNSHEIRLSSPSDGRLRAVAGVFYQQQTHDIEQKYRIDGLAGPGGAVPSLEVTGQPDTLWLTQQVREDDDAAVFGELAYDLTDRLTLTGGLRLFRAENSLRGFFGFGPGYSATLGEGSCFSGPILPDSPCTNLDKSVEESGSTHRVNLTYEIDEDRMVYATWSTGYRPGGINRRGSLPPYESDFLTNYEMGWKTTWMDGSLRWNGAVYALQWEDFQFSILGSNGLTEIKNAAQARVMGAESDVVWRVTPDLTLSGAMAYTDAELSENYCGFLAPDGSPETNCPSPQSPEGTELPVTPRLKANMTARYEFPVGSLDGFLQGSLVYVGENWTDLRLIERAIIGEQPAYTTADLSAGVSSDVWSATFAVSNLTDERASLYRYAQCAEQVCGARTYIVPNRPRMISIRLGWKF